MSLLSWLSKYKNSSQAVWQNHSSDVVPSEASTSHTEPAVDNPTGTIETDMCSSSCADRNSVFEQLDCNFLVAPSASKSVTACLIDTADKPALQHQRLLFPSCPHQPRLTSFQRLRSFVSAWYDK